MQWVMLILEILYMTNKIGLIMIFIINNALRVSGVIAHHQELMNCICSYGTGELIYMVIGSYRNYSLWNLEYVIQLRL